MGKPDLVYLKSITSAKKTDLDFGGPNSKNAIKLGTGKAELWGCLNIVERLIELSDSRFYLRMKEIFDQGIKKSADLILCSLSQI